MFIRSIRSVYLWLWDADVEDTVTFTRARKP